MDLADLDICVPSQARKKAHKKKEKKEKRHKKEKRRRKYHSDEEGQIHDEGEAALLINRRMWRIWISSTLFWQLWLLCKTLEWSRLACCASRLSSELCTCCLNISQSRPQLGKMIPLTAGLSQVFHLAGVKEENPMAEKMEIEQPRKRKERCVGTPTLLQMQASCAPHTSSQATNPPQGGAHCEIRGKACCHEPRLRAGLRQGGLSLPACHAHPAQCASAARRLAGRTSGMPGIVLQSLPDELCRNPALTGQLCRLCKAEIPDLPERSITSSVPPCRKAPRAKSYTPTPSASTSRSPSLEPPRKVSLLQERPPVKVHFRAAFSILHAEAAGARQ